MESSENITVPSSEAHLVPVPTDSNANPDVEALSNKFKGFGFLEVKSEGEPAVTYPPEVERRLKALKKLQVDMFNTECKFFEELHDLEIKYANMYSKYSNKRSEIISGKYEPTNEECDFTIPGQEDQEEEKEKKAAAAAAAATEESKKNGESESSTAVTGLPRFWLTIFQNVSQFADMVEDHDVPILEHLEDITVELTKEPMGFQLFFNFSPNEYFRNKVLTKTYEMRVQVDPKDPFAFEGTEFSKSVGCKIDWKDGKDVTVREIKKKQKHKSTGAIRMTNKLVPNPSFFDFFSPPKVDQEEEEASGDPEVQEKLTVDFELGSFLKERIIPRAVLYYTGEALESDDEFSDEEEEDSDEDEDGTGSDIAHDEEEQTEEEGVD